MKIRMLKETTIDNYYYPLSIKSENKCWWVVSENNNYVLRKGLKLFLLFFLHKRIVFDITVFTMIWKITNKKALITPYKF